MKDILLLLPEGFEMYEASVFIDVIGWNHLEGDGSTKLHTVGNQRIVTGSFGQKMQVDYLLEEIELQNFYALALPGGFEEFGYYKSAFSQPVLEIIRHFNAEGKIIASVCTGALPIAKSGVLTGRNATTYNKNKIRQDTLSHLGANLVNQKIVVDKNVITSWNPSTAIEVAFIFLAMITSIENAQTLKDLMGFGKVIKIF